MILAVPHLFCVFLAFFPGLGHPWLVFGDSDCFGCDWQGLGVLGEFWVFLAGFFWMFPASLSVSGQFLVFLADFVCSRLASGILDWFCVFSGRFGVFLAD